jgi:hypothetical protein
VDLDSLDTIIMAIYGSQSMEFLIRETCLQGRLKLQKPHNPPILFYLELYHQTGPTGKYLY